MGPAGIGEIGDLAVQAHVVYKTLGVRQASEGIDPAHRAGFQVGAHDHVVNTGDTLSDSSSKPLGAGWRMIDRPLVSAKAVWSRLSDRPGTAGRVEADAVVL